LSPPPLAQPVLQATDDLLLASGSRGVALAPFSVNAGQWLLLRPEFEAAGPDLAVVISRVLAALDAPRQGSVTFFGKSVQSLGYAGLSWLRTRLALIPSSGGLLSNRTLRENVALPISVHRRLSHAEETAEVGAVLARFELLGSADMYPHEVSGGTRLRACVARATVLAPALYIVEGTGEFISQHHVGLGWSRLCEAKARDAASVVVCVTRLDEDFEEWFRGMDGHVLQYRLTADATRKEGRLSR
jgi:ABC-type ATPase involved in cell division